MQVSDDQRVGTELAGYRIESLLGMGGMSVQDLRLKRMVALKLLAASLAPGAASSSRMVATRLSRLGVRPNRGRSRRSSSS